MAEQKNWLNYFRDAAVALDDIEQAIAHSDNHAFVDCAFCSVASFYCYEHSALGIALKIADAIRKGDRGLLEDALQQAKECFLEWTIV